MRPAVGVHRYVPGWLRPLSWWAGRGGRFLHHALRSARATVHPRPIFVLGNQKAGTSAIAALLAQMCDLSVSLDMLQETYFPTFQRVATGELSFSRYVRRNRWEFSHAVVKEPNLTLLHPWLAQAFPDAPIVFVMRDPRDNIRSLLNALGIPGDLARLEARHLTRVNPGWQLVLDGAWLGLAGDHYIDRLAARWVYCTGVYRENAARMHLSRYEHFLSDKMAELRLLAEQLGQPIVNDVSDQLDRRFQPRGDNSLGWKDFFGARNLARIESICGPAMREMGYAPAGP